MHTILHGYMHTRSLTPNFILVHEFDRAHQDEDIELSHVKFCKKINVG